MLSKSLLNECPGLSWPSLLTAESGAPVDGVLMANLSACVKPMGYQVGQGAFCLRPVAVATTGGWDTWEGAGFPPWIPCS